MQVKRLEEITWLPHLGDLSQMKKWDNVRCFVLVTSLLEILMHV